jgi:hypothetical protein
MNKSVVFGFSMLTSLSVFACGGGTGDAATEPASSGKAVVQSPATDSGTVSLSGTLRSLGIGAPLGAGPAVAMSVCAVEHDVRCTDSAADGTWSLSDVAANSRPTILLGDSQETPALYVHQISIDVGTEHVDVPASDTVVAAPGEIAQLTTKALDPAKGSIVFFATRLGTQASGPALEFASGVSVSAEGLADGPVFLDASGKPVAGASATAGSWGAFVDVPPGVYKVTFAHATAGCQVLGLDSSRTDTDGFATEQTVEVSVEAGNITGPLQVFCPMAK